MKRIMLMLATSAAITVEATQYSKLSIIVAAKERGCWQTLKTFIADADLKDEWDCCQYLSDDYPQFATVTNAIVSSGIATADDVSAILVASIDAAVPDAALRRVYSNDTKTSSGRSKWHGKQMRQLVDEAKLTKTTVYEDGTVFVDQAKTVATKRTEARPVMTNGIPVRLATARTRYAADAATTNTITTTLTAGD